MTITISALFGLSVGLYILNRWSVREHRKAIEQLKTLNEKQARFIEEQASEYREVLIFSVRAIIKEAIEKEDYETAKKCKDILDKYEAE